MRIVWSINDLIEIAKTRQKNKFDLVLVVSGPRGNSKSSFLFKFFSRIKGFRPWKHQVYSRNDVMRLLEGFKFGCIFDDEAIRTGYKRNFFDQDQKLLIQMINMYRDNFNIYGLAVPNFYNLDKDLRDLCKIHIHMIERGFGVIHTPNDGSLYSEDKWDIRQNKRIEDRWARARMKNPNYRPKYNRLTTFKGYIRFTDLTPKQRELYEDIKVTKRKAVYEEEMKKEETGEGFYDKLIIRIKNGEISRKTLQEVCLANDLKLSAVSNLLNTKFRDEGIKERLSDYFNKAERQLATAKPKPVKEEFSIRE